MCQPMSTGLHTMYDFKEDLQRFMLLQIKCVSKTTLQSIIPMGASNAPGPIIGQDKDRRSVWLRTV